LYRCGTASDGLVRPAEQRVHPSLPVSYHSTLEYAKHEYHV
jgi:hypothetical protein